MHYFSKLNTHEEREQNKCGVCGQPEADRNHPHIFDRALYQTTLCKCGLHIDATCHIPAKNKPTPYQKRVS